MYVVRQNTCHIKYPFPRNSKSHLIVKFLFQFDCPGVAPCFCPIIGEDCEKQRYSIPLHGLVSKFKHLGDHNRNYFFTVTVTNNAGLATVEHLDILVDESSPQAGVILEGVMIYL